jgi:hypothetical protein
MDQTVRVRYRTLFQLRLTVVDKPSANTLCFLGPAPKGTGQMKKNSRICWWKCNTSDTEKRCRVYWWWCNTNDTSLEKEPKICQ